jgi:glycine cleavage system transcriptional repressor
MAEYAVTAIGRDRPWIAAAISRMLLDLEGNIADSQMSILRGHFAVMLIVDLPGSVDAERLKAGLEEVREDLGLDAVAANPIDAAASDSASASHVLSVYGADHPGIVHAVASALADLGVNITDLETRLTGAEEAPVYVMLMELALGAAAEDDVEAGLAEVAGEARVEVSLRELGAEAL